MEDLVTWLRAQLDEDEWDARGIHDRDCRAVLYVEGEPLDGPCDCGWPARVLREVEAKRRLLDVHWRTTFTDVDLGIRDRAVCATCHGALDPGDDWDGEALQIVQVEWPCPTVRALALPFADRPGYQEEWKP